MIVKRGFSLSPPEITDIPTTPEQRAGNLAEHERHRLNVEWFNAHSADIVRTHRGKYVCVAGGELFSGDDPTEVYAEATAKHPSDRGATFRWFIPTHTGPTIYASQRRLGHD